MKKLIALFFTVSLIVISCKKYNEITNDVDGKLYIYGRLFIQDSINDNGTIKPLLKVISVSLTYKDDNSRILFTTNSDSNGYFTFSNLKQNAKYSILAETKTGTGDFELLYSAKQDVTLDNSKTDITPLLKIDTTKQNGVLYTIKDNLTNGLINDCNACFFSSQQLAAKDSCEYSLFTLPSNTNGLVLKTNLQPGRYYVLFKKKAGSLLLKSSDILDITPTGVIRKEIKLF